MPEQLPLAQAETFPRGQVWMTRESRLTRSSPGTMSGRKLTPRTCQGIAGTGRRTCRPLQVSTYRQLDVTARQRSPCNSRRACHKRRRPRRYQ